MIENQSSHNTPDPGTNRDAGVNQTSGTFTNNSCAFRSKSPEASHVEQVYMVRMPHVNGYGRLFGGQLMQWIDETAGICSRRHAECTITTAAIDNLSFKQPAFQNDTIVLDAIITYVGRTSMEVCVHAYVESLTGERKLINTAYVVMVAIEEDGTPRPVPGLVLETDEQKANWESGAKRNALRKQRKLEGF